MKKTITILGATGSVGLSTLDVISQYIDKFAVYALTANSQIDKLFELCQRVLPKYAVILDESQANYLQLKLNNAGLAVEVLVGNEALCEVASAPAVDMVMAAIVGSAGLLPTLAAAQAGKTILLANKETLVMAGRLFMQVAKDNQAKILPVDSEHNAIFQALKTNEQGELDKSGVKSIILTASGGPFLNTALAKFSEITPEMAVKHPKWSMGQKISVDSATMMNKGLEVIEAHWLFAMASDNIEVLIHPESIIHSMVRYQDGSILAQMGVPDMRIPIAYSLAYPERLVHNVEQLDFLQLSGLSFLPVDYQRFPCLQLAFAALNQQNDASCVLNAANEIAVWAFLAQQISFTDIAHVVETCLQKIELNSSNCLEDLMDKDRETRTKAQSICQSLSIS